MKDDIRVLQFKQLKLNDELSVEVSKSEVFNNVVIESFVINLPETKKDLDTFITLNGITDEKLIDLSEDEVQV